VLLVALTTALMTGPLLALFGRGSAAPSAAADARAAK